MGRSKLLYRVGGPSTDVGKQKSPYYCKWYELKTDRTGSREVQRTKWFSSLKDAEAHGQLVSSNRAVRNLTNKEKLIALHIFNECEERGLAPLEVHAAGLKHFGVQLVEDMPMDCAVELFCTWMVGEQYSPKTIQGYEGSLNWLMRMTERERSVATFSASELVMLVKGRYENYVSQKAFIRDLKSFFSWAGRQGYCSPEVSKQALLNPEKTKSSVRKSAERRTSDRPARLTVDLVETIFGAVESRYHAALALAVFAGLRPQSELPNVLWRLKQAGHVYGIDYDHKRVDLPKEWCTKTFRPRCITSLPPPFWRIMEVHRQEEGKISPSYTVWRKNCIQPMKEALGIDRWPTDFLRHSALSFMFVNAGQSVTQNNAGHSNPKMFFAHYNNAVGAIENEKFNNLFPNYPSLD